MANTISRRSFLYTASVALGAAPLLLHRSPPLPERRPALMLCRSFPLERMFTVSRRYLWSKFGRTCPC